MNASVKEFSKKYQVSLQACLNDDLKTDLTPATELGMEARRQDIRLSEFTVIHEKTVLAILAEEQAGENIETIRQAGIFFRHAFAELAKPNNTHRPGDAPAQESTVQSPGMSNVKARLRRESAKRKQAESALKEERRKYAKLLAESKIMQQQLRHLSHEVLWAQEEERKKISRELHDEISQILTGINVRLAALRIEATANAEHISEKIASAQRLVEKSVASVHRFARELRPALLDDLGLIPALTAHLKEVRKRTGLRIHLTASKAEMIEEVDSLKRTLLYRIAQEALNNVAKHAQASRVDVSVQIEPDYIRLEVSDNGKSFSVQEVLANKRRKRLGLIGMRERAEMVGGAFEIESVKDSGTTVRVRIPVRNGVKEQDSNPVER